MGRNACFSPRFDTFSDNCLRNNGPQNKHAEDTKRLPTLGNCLRSVTLPCAHCWQIGEFGSDILKGLLITVNTPYQFQHTYMLDEFSLLKGPISNSSSLFFNELGNRL